MIASRFKWIEITLAEMICWHETWLQLMLSCYVGLAMDCESLLTKIDTILLSVIYRMYCKIGS